MKNYDVVVKERYDKEKIGNEKTLTNIYSMYNNTGFNGAMNEYALLRKIVKLVAKNTGKIPAELKLLDVGCGKGFVVRALSELVEDSKNIYGTELSKSRILHNKKMNANIDIRYADITKPLPFDFKFDCVFSFDVLMHLKYKEQIDSALYNIYDVVDVGGYYLWYEPNVHSHFDDSDNDSDGAGFSVKEMVAFAERTGFKKVKVMHYHKYAKIGRFCISTCYMNRFPPFIIQLLSVMLPSPLFKPTINCILFRK